MTNLQSELDTRHSQSLDPKSATDEHTCPICLGACATSSFGDKQEAIAVLRCAHRMHLECMLRKNSDRQLVLAFDDCPLCRSSVLDPSVQIPEAASNSSDEDDGNASAILHFIIELAGRQRRRQERENPSYRPERHVRPSRPSRSYGQRPPPNVSTPWNVSSAASQTSSVRSSTRRTHVAPRLEWRPRHSQQEPAPPR
mmetsp:Transcript_7037/g.11111  ORF Transcript_7037/g.11111 Transcript_7037/m.11111 type:complete len:198 (-) Transcript_7037:1234-1827(-)